MTRLLVGLTGGLASGKSTVARMLRERGVPVLDADEVVAWLYRSGGEGTTRVRELFGPEYLNADGSVDRQALAALVFSDSAARTKLEHAIHPLVRDRFRQFAGERQGLIAYEATLLVESGGHEGMDHVVTVEADPARRLARAVARGADRESAQRRLGAQGSEATRTAAAHSVLYNDGSLEELEDQVDALLEELTRTLQRAGRASAPARARPRHGGRCGP